jgi:two-component system OmpR family sensor kinase
MLRSLRSQLLAWYAVVLLAVLATFASLAVWSVWRSTVRSFDDRLGAMAAELGRAVNLDPAGHYEVNLAGDDFAGFGAAENAPYYAIWTGDGTLIDRSDPLVEPPFPDAPHVRTRDGSREVIAAGAYGALVLVGQSLEQARSDVWTASVAFVVAGGVALLLASLGGWFLVGRALAPIGRIAETAEVMSESNLGLRIDVNRTEDEFGSVAAALNSAFDRLQDAFERQTRFTADASHELRTPLALQIAELEWALARRRSDAEYGASLRVCMNAAQRMRAVVEGLLTLARADAGAMPHRREPVDLRSVVREVAATLEGTAVDRGVRLAVTGDAVVVTGDPDRLRELVSNLIVNAIQYSQPGGHVTCSVAATEGSAMLEVSDTGPGIAVEDLPRIFDRFYRANTSRSRAAGGAGLGLAICKWIAESHGGRIGCESAGGQGARFSVEFPAARGIERASLTL